MPQSSAWRRRGASLSWSYRTRWSRVTCSGIAGSSIRPLTGLADGLAPDERRYAKAIRPTCLGPPLPGSSGDSAVVPRRIVTRAKNPARLRTYDKPHGRNRARGLLRGLLLARLADGLGHERRDVVGVLALDQVGRHLAVAAGAAVVDGVEDEVLRRPQLVEVRTDLGDRVGGLERVAGAAALPEQLAPVLLGGGQVRHVRRREVVAVLDGGDDRRRDREPEDERGEDEVEQRDPPRALGLRPHAPAGARRAAVEGDEEDAEAQRHEHEGEDEEGHAERQITRWDGRRSPPAPRREGLHGGSDRAEVGQLGGLGLTAGGGPPRGGPPAGPPPRPPRRGGGGGGGGGPPPARPPPAPP